MTNAYLQNEGTSIATTCLYPLHCEDGIFKDMPSERKIDKEAGQRLRRLRLYLAPKKSMRQFYLGLDLDYGTWSAYERGFHIPDWSTKVLKGKLDLEWLTHGYFSEGKLTGLPWEFKDFLNSSTTPGGARATPSDDTMAIARSKTRRAAS